MALPKQKSSRTRSKNRRYHYFRRILKQVPCFSICGNCENKKLPHTVCAECGYYKGRQVLDLNI